ncbi:MAG: triose-phosphate isomerase [Chloroflexi bacterium]|nr:triose-phosphate isomerase [Chloroflexota bacterium]
MPTPLIAGNWKMNTTIQEAAQLAGHLRGSLGGVSGVEVVLCPPYVSLSEVAMALQGSAIKVGAQNMHYEDKGAFTGEVSPQMLLGLCQYVILGHSERRRDFAETDAIVNRKVRKALASGLHPILCVGELLADRQAGREEAVVSASLRASLEDVAVPRSLVVAYEPVWAIGTGLAATSAQAQAMCALIRRLLAQQFGAEEARATRVLYGGSVTPANIKEFASQPDIDGGLVGGASLNAQQFTEIVRTTASARPQGRPA